MCVRFIFDPNEPYKIRWDLWIGALIMYSVIAIPYRLCFDVGRPISEMSEYSSAELGEFIWNKSVDVFFFIDMVFAFRTGYHDMAEDALITMPHDIARHYLRTWFLIDFFSCFPIEECMLPFSDGSGSSSAAGATKLLKVIRLFRLLKLVRLLKLSKYMDKIEDAVGVSPAVFEIIKLICQVSFVAHLFGCFWFYVSSNTTKETDTWYYSDYGNERKGHQYIASLYWAFTTMTTVGYGEIVPYSVGEKVYAIFIMLMGATIFAYMLANVANIAENMRGPSAKILEQIKDVTEYLAEKNASPGMTEMVKQHFKFAMQERSSFDEAVLAERLPLPLARDILYLVHERAINAIPIFEYIAQRSIVVHLFRLMTPARFDTGIFLFKEDELVSDIFFIVSGGAEVIKRCKPLEPDGAEQVVCAKARVGNFVGHEGILYAGPSQYSVRATALCSTYSLSKHDALRLVEDHPVVALQLQTALGRAICRQGMEFERSARSLRKKRMDRETSRQSELHKSVSLNAIDGAKSSESDLVEDETSAPPGSEGTATRKRTGLLYAVLQPIARRLSKVHIESGSAVDDAVRDDKRLEKNRPLPPRALSCPFIQAGYDDPGVLTLPNSDANTGRQSDDYGLEEMAVSGPMPKMHRSRTYSGPFTEATAAPGKTAPLLVTPIPSTSARTP